ncbi:MAG TPA: nuclear transport factor 2 family protein [Pyrinomonadaceae bacterium]|nr:nuclear transport factor 2 family protein [Pyrinomonadaceae bacterium]
MKTGLIIPKAIEFAVKAANDHDAIGFLSHFAKTAVITDEGHEYHGLAAIEKWSDEKLFGDNVTFDITDIRISGDTRIVTAKVDGDFDKTGLPDPFVMALHFVMSGSKINRLAFRLPEVRDQGTVK